MQFRCFGRWDEIPRLLHDKGGGACNQILRNQFGSGADFFVIEKNLRSFWKCGNLNSRGKFEQCRFNVSCRREDTRLESGGCPQQLINFDNAEPTVVVSIGCICGKCVADFLEERACVRNVRGLNDVQRCIAERFAIGVIRTQIGILRVTVNNHHGLVCARCFEPLIDTPVFDAGFVLCYQMHGVHAARLRHRAVVEKDKRPLSLQFREVSLDFRADGAFSLKPMNLLAWHFASVDEQFSEGIQRGVCARIRRSVYDEPVRLGIDKSRPHRWHERAKRQKGDKNNDVGFWHFLIPSAFPVGSDFQLV